MPGRPRLTVTPGAHARRPTPDARRPTPAAPCSPAPTPRPARARRRSPSLDRVPQWAGLSLAVLVTAPPQPWRASGIVLVPTATPTTIVAQSSIAAAPGPQRPPHPRNEPWRCDQETKYKNACGR